MTGEPTSFGPFTLDRSSGTLLSSGKAIPLGHRAFALLDALASADGPVNKAALVEAAWPGTIVEEGNLPVQIAALRKALGTRPDGQEWIIAVPRVGYRLLRGDTRAPDVLPPLRTSMQLPSIAILPFQNLSSDPEQGHFARGLVENIRTALGRFQSIRIVAPNPLLLERAVDARDVARQLQVRFVLQGSVRRAGSNLRITSQLVDGETGADLWSEHFDGLLENVFAVQDRITSNVVLVAEPRIRQAEIARTRLKPPSNLESYDLYLQAMSLRSSAEPRSIERAVELIERSLALDPDFLPALATGAAIEAARHGRQLAGAGEVARRRGVGYAERVLASLSADADARALAGHALIQLDEQYHLGMTVLRQALAANVNSITVLSYAGIGALRSCEFDAAETWFMRAIDLNIPDFAGHLMLTGMCQVRICQQRNDEAIDWGRRALAVAPHGPIALWWLMVALAHSGRVAEAAQLRPQLEMVLPGCTIARYRKGQTMRNERYVELMVKGLRLAGVPED